MTSRADRIADMVDEDLRDGTYQRMSESGAAAGSATEEFTKAQLQAAIRNAYFWIRDKDNRCTEGVNRAAVILKTAIDQM